MGLPIFDHFYSFFSWSGSTNVKFYAREIAITKKKNYFHFLMERPYYILKYKKDNLNFYKNTMYMCTIPLIKL